MKCKKCDGRGYYSVRENLITIYRKDCEICNGVGHVYIVGTLTKLKKEHDGATNELDKRRILKKFKEESELHTQHLKDKFNIEVE